MDETEIRVTRTIELDADPAEVWDLVGDGEQWAEWMVDHAAVDVSPGSVGHVDDAGERRDVRVDTVTEGEGVTFEWWPAGRPDLASAVELRVLPAPRGTMVEVVEAFPATSALQARAASRAWGARDRHLVARLAALRIPAAA